MLLGERLPEREAVRNANLYAGLPTTRAGVQESSYDRARFDAACLGPPQGLLGQPCAAYDAKKLMSPTYRIIPTP